jgi:membrane-bound serine protease (ClpP class)
VESRSGWRLPLRKAWLALVAAPLCAAFVTSRGTAQSSASEATAPDAPQIGAIHVKLAGELDVGMQSLLRRAMDRARKESSVLVVELDTPGGELELMWNLGQQISEATDNGVLTVAWVHDHAFSAGVYLAIACKKVYMSAAATIGSATPVTLGPSGITSIQDPDTKEKTTSAMRATFRSFAAKRGRSPGLAEAMIDRQVGVRLVQDPDGTQRVITDSEWDDARMKGNPPVLVRTIAQSGELVALTGPEAVALGFADGVAETLDDVLAKVGARGASARSVPRERSEDLAAFLDRIRLLLLIAGIVAIYVEFKAPGFSGAGVVAIACFGLLLFGRFLVGLADVPHIVAVAVGLVLIAVELFVVPGQLWAGLLGAVLVIGGLAFAQFGPGLLEYPLARSMALDDALKMLTSIFAAMLIGYGVSRFLPRTPLLNRLVLEPTLPPGDPLAVPVLAGEAGAAITDLRPVGKVRLDRDPRAEHEARSSGLAVDRGARVRVVAVEGQRLVVEAEAALLEQEH